MSEVYQSRSILRENGNESGALQVREAQRLAQEVASKKETERSRTKSAIPQGDQGRKRRRGSEGNRIADPNLSHAAVKAYRDAFRLCPNYGRRKDIVSTVENLALWNEVLTEWKEQKWNPLKLNWMLSDYERRLSGGQRISERKRSQKDMQTRVSKWRQSNLSCVQEGEGIRFRASSKTLEEVVTEALRANHRS